MMMSPSGMSMQASGVPIANLVGMLQQQSGRPIYDKTNLQGLYDIKLTLTTLHSGLEDLWADRRS